MYRQIPNLITVSRLVLTVVFFVLLNTHQSNHFAETMWISFVIYVVAGLTDILDGYLARAWKVESAFGRVVDPFVDKIMVCGAFVFFSSTEFINKDLLEFNKEASITGVAPWMVVVLIGREFLITGIRGLAESRGIDFRADWTGKIKMFVQSFAIGAIMVDVATAFHYGEAKQYDPIAWVHLVRDISIWATVIVTAASATTYIMKARKLMSE